ncbi:hypothetical protein [Rhodobium gokarnense]|uniref:Uncharacterized protein n=1 Tax=Rhodobium gokarnense TaxID=364296 RepID=A0ABT3H6U5_9HYPH|nr:hypothetical protein [Rhodobium gokarnense]MCW2306111.1 hypothetical protein [Rhodobium gokarnense]
MLGSLPKLADKAFIIGFLLPSVLFAVALTTIFSDVPEVAAAAKAMAQEKALENFVYLAVAVWLFAVLLSLVNTILFKILEGYTLPFAAPLEKRAKARFDALKARIKTLGDAWIAAGDTYPPDKQKDYDDALFEFVTTFPSDRDKVLPTRFGNAIRAFEDYPRQVYSADSIPLWIHLCTVMPDDFLKSVEDNKTQVSAALNLTFLSLIVALVAGVRFALDVEWTAIGSPPAAVGAIWAEAELLAFVVGAAIVARLSYLLAVERAIAWGAVVKAAFDCYLPALAKAMGYELPGHGKERRAFWTAVSRRAIYHRDFEPSRWHKRKPSRTRTQSPKR